MKTRAMIFSVDAAFAVLLAATSIVTILMLFVPSTLQPAQNELFLAQTLLVSMSKAAILSDAVLASDTTEIETVLDKSILTNQCGNITIYDDTNAQILTASKSGCGTSSQSVASFVTFYADAPYSARLLVWRDQ